MINAKVLQKHRLDPSKSALDQHVAASQRNRVRVMYDVPGCDKTIFTAVMKTHKRILHGIAPICKCKLHD